MGKQISIFVENKPGKISKITEVLKNAKINLRAMTIADSGSFGIIKIMTDNNQKAYNVLKESNFLVTLQDVVVVEIPDRIGSFHKVAKILEKNKVNIEDAYGFIKTEGVKAVLILKVKNVKIVEKILKESGYNVVEF
ncbi:MAG: acetolactate synthase [Candidatus Omnitrophica bacterium]|nr:acetolactate synthase [Candidatus Omnitrophota bacterium]MCM8806734.1 acetolactate synthase [Candidatus Omnitrophota bacterium]